MLRIASLAIVLAACGPTPPIRPVVDTPTPVCRSEVESLFGEPGRACTTPLRPTFDYVRARVRGHDILSFVEEECGTDDVGVIECGEERNAFLMVDGERTPLEVLTSIGDLRSLDEASQRAMLLAGVRGTCEVATDVAGRASIANDAALALPVGFDHDARGLVLRAIEACPASFHHHWTFPSVARIEARLGERGVEIAHEVVDPGGVDR